MKNPKTETDRFLPRTARRISLALVIGVVVTSLAWLRARAGGDGGATHMRWDLVHLLTADTPPVLSAGGIDWAKAADGSQITLTGSGTWLSVPGRGEPQAVTGGGTWETFDSSGASTGSGSYMVTRLVSFDVIPGLTPAVGTDDQIGNPLDSRSGLLILRVLYSDGEEGVLTISCNGGVAPGSVYEGMTATKSVVGYVDRGKPAPGLDANRTAFHVLHHGGDRD